jgi:KipI family sensor histidine kinase inhibitor
MAVFQPAGDSALLVILGGQIDLATNRRVHALARRLAEHPLEGAGEAVPGYTTLLVHYDPLRVGYERLAGWVEEALAGPPPGAAGLEEGPADLPAARRVEIPVRYGGEWGPDLEDVAQHCGLSTAEVVRIHTAGEYSVFLIGFLPGFPYLGGMDKAIACPRLATPRLCVPAGSVGIAGEQTGIYPLESPGGWRIIGRSRLLLFDIQRDPPALLAPGDMVRFVEEC